MKKNAFLLPQFCKQSRKGTGAHNAQLENQVKTDIFKRVEQ
ncbi:MAG: hypothetical protein ACYTDW_11920 [Planctomycetota bacterium]